MGIDDFEAAYVRPKTGRTLIVGSRVYGDKPDRRKLYANAVGVDMQEGEGVDDVVDMEECRATSTRIGMFDHVECMSVLEHSKRPWLLAETIDQCMWLDSTIYVTVPFCWRHHSYPGDYWRVSVEALEVLFPSIEWIERRYVSETIVDGTKLPAVKVGRHPYIARTETCGFGVKR